MALKSTFEKVKNWYGRYERHVSSLALLGGFIFDAITLKRVDLFLENFWIIVHLAIAAIGIILLNLFEPRAGTGGEGNTRKEVFRVRMHFWLILIVQFAFGGLLSTFLVFYFRSATLSASWPFLLLLAIVFTCNEIFKKHYTRLSFQISVLFISIFSFFIFSVPVVLHQIGDKIFILSGLLSLAALGVFLIILWSVTRERFVQSRRILLASIVGIYVLINILYFANIIPPLPLSLKSAGVYHSILRVAPGSYEATVEPQSWFDQYFSQYEPYHETVGEPVYAYSAVFSPALINTNIIHEWQYFDEKNNAWKTSSRIVLPIVGGGDGGYHTYSLKYSVFPGKWRINIETQSGQYLGRIKFEILNATNTPTTQEVTL